MGGWNSGRKAEVNCTEDYLSIDARQWQRDGVLVAGTNHIPHGHGQVKNLVILVLKLNMDK